jgi:hypothetical protein
MGLDVEVEADEARAPGRAPRAIEGDDASRSGGRSFRVLEPPWVLQEHGFDLKAQAGGGVQHRSHTRRVTGVVHEQASPGFHAQVESPRAGGPTRQPPDYLGIRPCLGAVDPNGDVGLVRGCRRGVR